MSAANEQHHFYESTQNSAPGNGSLEHFDVIKASTPYKHVESQGNGDTADHTPVIDVQAIQSPPSATANPEEIEPEPTRKVHFHGRVRITSGVGHSGRHKSDWLQKEDSHSSVDDGNPVQYVDAMEIPPRRDNLHQSADSSTSASYSSSISAPLRSSTELPPRAASSRFSGKRRKPLSNVLGSQEANSWLHTLAVERQERKNKRMTRTVDETSPLLQASNAGRRNVMNQDVRPTGESSNKPDDDDDAGHGDWPWNLFTLTYWESQLSALCCCETDSED